MSWWAYNWTIKTIWWRRWWRKSKDDLPHFEVECSTNIHWHGNKFVFGKVMDAFGYMQWQRMMVVKHDTGQTKVIYLVREMIMWGMYVRYSSKQEAYEFIKIVYKDKKIVPWYSNIIEIYIYRIAFKYMNLSYITFFAVKLVTSNVKRGIMFLLICFTMGIWIIINLMITGSKKGINYSIHSFWCYLLISR